jgi:hypothetical protein
MKKKKYDTSAAMVYLLKQKHLLPPEFRKKIAYSNRFVHTQTES